MNKIKTLYASGCSWTAGEELAPLSDPNRPSIMYYNSYPWFVAQTLNIPILLNEARGAGSNFRIFRRTCEYITDYVNRGEYPSSLMILIGWTTLERHEIGIKDRIVPLTIQNPLIPNSLDHIKDEIVDYQKTFYNNYSDQYGERLQILYMTTLRLLCKSLGIHYFDFIALGKSINLYPSYLNLQTVVPETYHTYVADNKLSVHEYKHPTKETHKIWSNKLCEKISTLL